ncbi:signal transduction histidine kinase [Sphingomonas sp. UYAg733]
MASLREKPPVWFWVVAIVITLWGVMGVIAFYMDVAMTDAAKAQLSDYDRTLLASRPSWFVWLYAVSTIGGLLGGIALLARSATARLFFIASLIGVILQFGWIFAVTDLIAVKGFIAACVFPIFIAIVAMLQLWFAGIARKRAWIT